MKVVFRQSFVRDLKKVKDQSILARIRRTIERTEEAVAPQELREL
jgi:hypothetical protein